MKPSSSSLPLDLSPAKKLLLEKRLQGAARKSNATPSIRRCERPRYLPLSFAQQRLWFLDQLAPGNAVYNIFQALRIKGPLSVPTLEQSLTEIVRRHEALRTTFTTMDGQPVQVIGSDPRVKVGTIDLRPLPPQKQDEAAQRLAREEAAKPFDLTRDLMLRATLLQLDNEDQVLVITMHHIASDGWSLGVLFRELSALYNAAIRGTTLNLPELSVQYPDYALWQRDWLQGNVLEKPIAYWKEQLAGAPDVLELPTDRPRPAEQTFRGAAQLDTLPLSLLRGLNALSRQEGATLYMTLLTAFNILLHRYTRQTDIVVGSPIAGRTQVEVEGLIGFFINTLALRTDLSGSPTFRELLARTRKVTLEAYAHQDVPFDKLVLELQPERSSSHMPLFQVMFALQSAPAETLDLSGLTITAMDVDNGTSKFDLTLAVTELEHGLGLDLEYNEDVFDASTIRRMLGHFRTLLEGIVAHPEQRISELPIMTATERHQLLVEWNQTQVDYPKHTPVHVLFEQQVEKRPEAIAVQFERYQLTYRELNARANQLAHYLKQLGAAPGNCIGVYLERSHELIIAFLAILKCGGAYLPLDRSYPRDRIEFMLKDAKVPLLLTEQRLIEDLPKDTTRLITIDTDLREIFRQSRANLPNTATGESLAYVIYTSGSTGRPKGACIPHRAINRLVINSDYVRFDPSVVMAQVSNASFDAATFEIWGALLNGGRLVVITKDVVLEPREFAEQLRRNRITTIFLTTSLFNLLAREVPGAFSGLRDLVFGGEAADARVIADVLKNHPPARLVNGYGPTETTTFAAWYEPRHVPDGARSIPIGRPLANSELYVLDEHLQPVPIGVPGELYIGGGGVGCGYLNRPELTADRFIPHPFNPNSAVRLYKTGDLARYLPDGNVDFLGRIDLQVKIRGFRVEPGEIETMINQIPGIRESVVTLREDSPGEKRLVGYYVVQRGAELSPDTILQHLKQRLPAYMVPSALMPLPALPINPNGKVDRRALPAPDLSRSNSEKQVTAPRDAVEEQLVRIWEKVLDVRPIGIRNKFFQLGGHSLLAVKLASEIEREFGHKLSVATVFRAPTIEQIATVLRGGEITTPPSAIVELQPSGSRPALFLVHGVGGGMFWGYQNLSRHLGDSQPVYVIRSHAMDGKEEFKHIEEMAAQYVADLRAFQPKGPYYLGGYCFGGNVAYEMARQLTAQGEVVGFLGLMNCAPPNSSYTAVRWTPAVFFRFLLNAALWVGNVFKWTPVQRREFLRWKLRTWRRKIPGLRHSGATSQIDHSVEELVDLSAHSEEERRLWSAHIRALFDYHPSPYGGQVTLFRSRIHQFVCSFDPDCGWSELARGGVRLNVVGGPHEGILEEPYVRQLASEFAKCLQTAQQEHGSGPQPPDRGEIKELAIVTEARPAAPEVSFAQQQVSHARDLGLASAFGNVVQALRLRGSLDVSVLERSIADVIRRHEILTSRFILDDGVARQEPASTQPFRLQVQQLPAAEQLLLAIQEDANRPFNPEAGSVFRAILLRLSADDHVLVLAAHPLAADEASLVVLFSDIGAVYNRLLARISSSPAGQRSVVSHPTFDETQWPQHVKFWRQQREARRQVKLDSLKERRQRVPAVGLHRNWAVQLFDLPARLLDEIKRFSQREGVTVTLVLLAAFGILVGRTIREQDLPIRAKLGLRNRPEVRYVVGRIAEVVELHLNISPQRPIREFIRSVRDLFQEVVAHLNIPFSRLIKEIGSVREEDIPPPAVGFEFYDREATPQMQGLVVNPVHVPSGAAELNLKIEQNDNSLIASLEYDTALLGSEAAQRFLCRYEALLEVLVKTPEATLAQLPVLSREERETVLVKWNATDAEFPTQKTWVELFEERVTSTPDARAVEYKGQQLSYRELDEKASRLAERLQQQGVRPGALVALALERSIDFAVAVIATLKSGAAYLPLDLTNPPERLAQILADAAPGLIVGHERFLRQLPETAAAIYCLNSAGVDPKPGVAVNPNLRPDSLAYVMFTSGSSGRPKGVEITHRSLVNHCFATARNFGLDRNDRVLQFSSLSFDISVEEMFPTWTQGGCVVFRTDEVLGSMDSFFDFVEQNFVTVLDLPTAFWHELVRFLEHRPLPPTVRLVVIGGEAASSSAFEAWQRNLHRAGTAVRLINTYGPTEATVTATIYEPTGPENTNYLPIGKPVANTKVYVLDDEMHPVPIGTPGELYIGGAGLARGYLGRADLTAEKFLTSFPSLPSVKRLYRSGDIVRWRSDGNLEFIGRADNQVKISGFRIEPGEIEAALATHPSIAECTVAACDVADQDKRLAAYYVAAAHETPSENELREYLAARLPAHMVPASFVPLSALPRNAHGKIDRAALPDPARVTNQEARSTDPFENQIVDIWREVLGVSEIRPEDNFFHLGGNSLRAMQVVTRLQAVVDDEVSVNDLFKNPTAGSFAATIFGLLRRRRTNGARRPTAGAASRPIKRASRHEAIPLSFAQQRLWFLQQLDPSSSAYHIAQGVHLTGSLNRPALEKSLNEIVRRHESLRTVILEVDGKPSQTVLGDLGVPFKYIEMDGAEPSAVQQRLVEEGRVPFDLSNDPMLRAVLIGAGADDHWLLITIHHIAADAWSIGVFLEELASLYHRWAADISANPDLPALPVQYADFAVWQRNIIQGPLLETQTQYWREALKGAPALLELPTDRPRPATPSGQGARQPIRIPKEIAQPLKALCEQENCTLFMGLLAAFQALLARYTNRQDIIVGSPAAGRTRAELEPLIGFFVNTLVFRGDTSGNPTFREFLRQIHETALAAFRNQDVPFEKLVEQLHPVRDPSYNPIFQVMFALQNVPAPNPNCNVSWEPHDIDLGTAKFDLTLELTEKGDELEGWIEYSTDLFDAWRMERMAGHLATLLESVSSSPDARLSHLRLITDAEWQTIVIDWNRTDDDTHVHECPSLISLFEAQAAKTPEQAAIMFKEQSLTYGELNQRADQLAKVLRSLGVGPEVLVGVCMNRSIEMVVAMLGILKAGGAYLPLDPNYPQDRLAFILSDARASVLLTQSHLLGKLPVGGQDNGAARIVCLDDSHPEVISQLGNGTELTAGDQARNSKLEIRNSNLAYVIYTSGSTGKPKGVAIEHRSVIAFLRWARRVFTDEELSGVLFVTSICFDLSVFELFAPLSWGGKAILADDALGALNSELNPNARQITLINTVPSLVAEWLRGPQPPANIRTVNLAGEPLAQSLVDQIFTQWPHVRKVNDLYGPTEATVYSTHAERVAGGSPNIGRPLTGEQTYILDPNQQPVPVGVPGELYIGGAGLAREYLNRPELTAEKFVTIQLLNPNLNPIRLYRTGDLARYRPDGVIEFLGRIDHQVKIRGYRIELGEIEARLREHPALNQVVVIAAPGARTSSSEAQDQRLVAYYTVKSAAEAPELRAFLKQTLPEYMVPALFIKLKELPLTPNGKIDRKALPDPETAALDHRPTTINQQPSIDLTTTQRILADIWADVLGLSASAIGIHDNFFELGGHSLLITKVLSRLRDAIELELPMRVMFEAPTIAEMANIIEDLLIEEIQQLSEEEAEKLDAELQTEPDAEELKI